MGNAQICEAGVWSRCRGKARELRFGENSIGTRLVGCDYFACDEEDEYL